MATEGFPAGTHQSPEVLGGHGDVVVHVAGDLLRVGAQGCRHVVPGKHTVLWRGLLLPMVTPQRAKTHFRTQTRLRLKEQRPRGEPSEGLRITRQTAALLLGSSTREAGSDRQQPRPHGCHHSTMGDKASLGNGCGTRNMWGVETPSGTATSNVQKEPPSSSVWFSHFILRCAGRSGGPEPPSHPEEADLHTHGQEYQAVGRYRQNRESRSAWERL